MTRTPYTYVVLRYVHDPTAGETLNIGVLVHSLEGMYVDVMFEGTYSRMSSAFAGFDGKDYHRVTGEFKRTIAKIRDVFSQTKIAGEFADAATIASRFWPDRGLSFRVGEILAGLSSDLPATTRQLFERFVTSQFTRREHKRRDEVAVWQAVEGKFQRNALALLAPVEVETKYGEQIFQHGFRNDRLHVLEPLSFDYVDSANILDVATKWRGRLDIIATASEAKDAQFSFIVGTPKPEHKSAAERAMQMMRDSAANAEVIPEDVAGPFAERFSMEILSHAQ